MPVFLSAFLVTSYSVSQEAFLYIIYDTITYNHSYVLPVKIITYFETIRTHIRRYSIFKRNQDCLTSVQGLSCFQSHWTAVFPRVSCFLGKCSFRFIEYDPLYTFFSMVTLYYCRVSGWGLLFKKMRALDPNIYKPRCRSLPGLA